MQPQPDRETPIQLGAGESLLVYLKAGTTIASTSGQLNLTGGPGWLGGQVFRNETRLAEGDALQLEGSGWVTLTAAAGSSTVHICRVAASTLLKHWLHKTASMFVPGRTARTRT